MRRGVWVLLGLVAAEVVVFGLLEGNSPRDAGNPLLYFLYWFQDAAMHAGPMIVIALATRLTVTRSGVDVSLPGAAALFMGIMTWCPGDARFWWAGLSVLVAAAVGMGLLSGAAVKRVRVNPLIVTLILGGAYRGLTAVVAWGHHGSTMLLVPGFDHLESFRYGLPLVLGITAAVAAVLWARPSVVGKTPGGVIAPVLTIGAAMLYTAQGRPIGPGALLGVELQAMGAVMLAAMVSGSRLPALSVLLSGLAIGMLEEAMRSGFAARRMGHETALVVFYVVVAVVVIAGMAGRGAPLRGRL